MVHFPNLAKAYPFRGKGFYKMEGKVVDDFGVHIIEVSKMKKMPLVTNKIKYCEISQSSL